MMSRGMYDHNVGKLLLIFMWFNQINVSQTVFLKLTFRKYPAIHTNTAPLYNIIIIYDTILRQKRKNLTRKIMNATVLPSLQFGMNCQGFAAG